MWRGSDVRFVETEKLLSCVHCGLCVNACPTYLVTGLEVESPRGRIHMAKLIAEGRSELTPSIQDHWELCLQCRACEAVCPSGVPYGRIQEHARAQLDHAAPKQRDDVHAPDDRSQGAPSYFVNTAGLGGGGLLVVAALGGGGLPVTTGGGGGLTATAGLGGGGFSDTPGLAAEELLASAGDSAAVSTKGTANETRPRLRLARCDLFMTAVYRTLAAPYKSPGLIEQVL